MQNRSGFGNDLDGAILRRARRGDRAALGEIYSQFGRHCYTLAMRVLGESAAAEDVVQDVFVRLIDALPRFRGEAPFGAWLKRMTVNATIDVLRRDRRLVALDEELPEMAAPVHAGAAEIGVDAWALLKSLPPRARAVVVLHEVEGYTHKEMATLFGQSESYSKSLLSRSLRRLEVQAGLAPARVADGLEENGHES